MQAKGQLFACHLGGDHPHWQIGNLILGIEPWARRHLGGEPLTQVIDPIPPLGRDHEGLGEGEGLIHLLGQGKQHLSLHPVNLVDCQGNRLATRHLVPQTVDDRLRPLSQPAMRFDQQDHNVSVRRTAPSCLNHRAVQTAARAENAGRVHEHDLTLRFNRNPPNSGAGRLHLMRHNRDLGPHHSVQKRRFPRIRFADQGDESGACSKVRLSHSIAPSGPKAPGLRPVRRRVSCWRGRFPPRHCQALPRR